MSGKSGLGRHGQDELGLSIRGLAMLVRFRLGRLGAVDHVQEVLGWVGQSGKVLARHIVDRMGKAGWDWSGVF